MSDKILTNDDDQAKNIDFKNDNAIMLKALNTKINEYSKYQTIAQVEINGRTGAKWAGGKGPTENWGGRHPEIPLKHYRNEVRENRDKREYLEERINHAKKYPENSYMRHAILWDACNELHLWDTKHWDSFNNDQLTITKEGRDDKQFALYKKLMQLDRHRAELYVKGQAGDKVAETKAEKLSELLEQVDKSIEEHFGTDQLQTKIESDLKKFTDSPELQAHRHWAGKIAKAVLNALSSLPIIGSLVKHGITKTTWHQTKTESQIHQVINAVEATLTQ